MTFDKKTYDNDIYVLKNAGLKQTQPWAFVLDLDENNTALITVPYEDKDGWAICEVYECRVTQHAESAFKGTGKRVFQKTYDNVHEMLNDISGG